MPESRSRAWILQVPLLLGAGQLIAGCTNPITRCWNIGTCGESAADGGTQDPAQRDAAEPTALPTSTQGSATVPGGSASSELTGTPGSATETMGVLPPGDPSSVQPSATSSAPPPIGEDCKGDADCPSGVCVDEHCAICDASNDHGCENAASGKRCLASDAESRCVECLAGDEYAGPAVPCGLNARGNQLFACTDNAWVATDCEDPDECKFGDLGDSDVECGVGNSGHYANECPDGTWQVDTSTCIPDGSCIDTDFKVGTTECGFSGYFEEVCVTGQWSVQTTCIECQRPFYLPDEEFAAALRIRHSVDTNPLQPDVVMQSLRLDDADIVDLTGIQCFRYLSQVNAQNNLISDLTPLAGATELEQLYIEMNPVKDLRPLGSLSKLKELDISNSGLTSLDGLQTLIRLELLDASFNNLADVSPLLPLTKLQTLWLSGNPDLDCAGSALTQLKNRVPAFEIYSDCP